MFPVGVVAAGHPVEVMSVLAICSSPAPHVLSPASSHVSPGNARRYLPVNSAASWSGVRPGCWAAMKASAAAVWAVAMEVPSRAAVVGDAGVVVPEFDAAVTPPSLVVLPPGAEASTSVP